MAWSGHETPIRNLNLKFDMQRRGSIAAKARKSTKPLYAISRGDSQKFSIIQTLLSLVIPAMASSRPFGAGTP